jgi:hypothetical protein
MLSETMFRWDKWSGFVFAGFHVNDITLIDYETWQDALQNAYPFKYKEGKARLVGRESVRA